ncbi:hypothetical protein [Streptomyces sp. CO7]
MHRHGREEILGTAYSNHDLLVFLEGTGVTDLVAIPDDPQWQERRSGHAHEFNATCTCRLISVLDETGK